MPKKDSVHVLLSAEEKAEVDAYCAAVGLSLTEHFRRASRLYRRLAPAEEITLGVDMSKEEWDLLKYRIEDLRSG